MDAIRLSHFLDHIEVTPDGCWTWTGDRATGRLLAHRCAFEHFAGPIPDGLDIDHTCHNRSDCAGGATCPHRRCVNPDHLEPCTRGENVLRGAGRSAQARRSVACQRGHRFDAMNTYVRPNGRRMCRACAAAALDRRTNHPTRGR